MYKKEPEPVTTFVKVDVVDEGNVFRNVYLAVSAISVVTVTRDIETEKSTIVIETHDNRKFSIEVSDPFKFMRRIGYVL